MSRPDPLLTLVALDWTRDKDPRIPLGHASLLAALGAAGIATASIARPVNAAHVAAETLADEILGASGSRSDVAIGVYVWNEPLVQRLLPQLRRSGHRGRIILGGPQITYAGAGVESLYPHADVFVRGYAEEALVELVRQPERRTLAGVHWRGQRDVVGMARPDLATLPSPWLSGAVPVVRGGFVRMETQRGCPFRCTFCQHREGGPTLSRRGLGAGRVADEIALFAESGAGEVALLDPVFNAGPDQIAVLQQFRDVGFSGRITAQCRFEMIDDSFLDACRSLDIVLEFGLQTIHAEEARVVGRRNVMAMVEDVMDRLAERRIPYEVSLIFGLPMQTLASFRESVDFCLRRAVPVLRAFPLVLLRGTELQRQRERWRLRESDDAIPMVTASSTFDTYEWSEMARISEALKATEGHHPSTVERIEALAGAPQRERFTPCEVTR